MARDERARKDSCTRSDVAAHVDRPASFPCTSSSSSTIIFHRFFSSLLFRTSRRGLKMPSATSMNHLRGGTALVLGLALLRAGIGTALLVILCSGCVDGALSCGKGILYADYASCLVLLSQSRFLLTNPWIRTLLELPQADGKVRQASAIRLQVS